MMKTTPAPTLLDAHRPQSTYSWTHFFHVHDMEVFSTVPIPLAKSDMVLDLDMNMVLDFDMPFSIKGRHWLLNLLLHTRCIDNCFTRVVLILIYYRAEQLVPQVI
ncbi:hypothetical protein LIER_27858 [Lithospermum erythrorhizon]|uniref:Uncharacterized protein n=1 Tax=Lithospermum erythrorhizon TaxID=34254 RepID=A0AAV3REP4_LITER